MHFISIISFHQLISFMRNDSFIHVIHFFQSLIPFHVMLCRSFTRFIHSLTSFFISFILSFHFMSFHSIPFHCISFIPFHSIHSFISFHSIPFHSIPFHSIHSFISFHFMSRHVTSCHFISFIHSFIHFIHLFIHIVLVSFFFHDILLCQFISFHFTSFHFTSLNFVHFTHSLVRSFIRSFHYSFRYSFHYSFHYSFRYSFHPFRHSFIHSFHHTHSLHSFRHPLVSFIAFKFIIQVRNALIHSSISSFIHVMSLPPFFPSRIHLFLRKAFLSSKHSTHLQSLMHLLRRAFMALLMNFAVALVPLFIHKKIIH